LQNLRCQLKIGRLPKPNLQWLTNHIVQSQAISPFHHQLLRYFKGICVFQDVLPALLLSLKVSFWASGLNLVLGVAVGWLLARCRFPGRNLLDVVLTLPMVMPPTVMGYYLLVLFGHNGVLGQLLQEYFGISLIFTWQGAVLAATAVTFPLVCKPARAALPWLSANWRMV